MQIDNDLLNKSAAEIEAEKNTNNEAIATEQAIVKTEQKGVVKKL